MTKYYPLTIVATPIGNLAEVSPLAQKTLAETRVIICEDTRITKKLLTLLAINHDQKLVSFNLVNEQDKHDHILQLLTKQPCVLVSDAGYPVISDPGFRLVATLRKSGAKVNVVNGPCAFIHAIVTSGIDSRKVFFANFLTKKRLTRLHELAELKSLIHLCTVVYYEPLNYLIKGLQLLKSVFGNIKIGICRELTKLNESFYFDYIDQLIDQVKLRGEFVVIIPRQEKISPELSWTEILAKVNVAVAEGMNLKQACKLVANQQYSASSIYKQMVIFLKKSSTDNNEK